MEIGFLIQQLVGSYEKSQRVVRRRTRLIQNYTQVHVLSLDMNSSSSGGILMSGWGVDLEEHGETNW